MLDCANALFRNSNCCDQIYYTILCLLLSIVNMNDTVNDSSLMYAVNQVELRQFFNGGTNVSILQYSTGYLSFDKIIFVNLTNVYLTIIIDGQCLSCKSRHVCNARNIRFF